MARTAMSRRGFLKASGALVVAFGLVPGAGTLDVLAAGAPAGISPDQVDSWLAIAKDGLVTVKTGKVELGTGVETATRQIAADLLDVAYDKVRIIQGDTTRTPDQKYTAGSQSLKTQWAEGGLREAAATARDTLLGLAAKRLGAEKADLTVKDGVVSVAGKASRQVSYAELLGGKPFRTPLSTSAAPKTPDQYRIIGTSKPRVDIPAKVTGTFMYVQDVRVDGMLHGRVLRPLSWGSHPTSMRAFARTPKGTIANAQLESIDEGSIKDLPGVVKVVRVKNFAGVVAEREEQAIAAAQSVIVNWRRTTPLPSMDGLADALRGAKVANTRWLANSGDVDGAMAGAPRRFQATYLHPYQKHASIGPSCAVADVRASGATVWSGTQGVYPLRSALATLLDMPEEKIHVIYVEASGCYGLNGADDAALSAALMSKSAGKPVRVQYMRADEIGFENYGNALLMQLEAGVDAAGTIIAWDYQGWTPNRGSRPGPPGNLPTGVLAGFPEKPAPKSPPPSPPLGDDTSNAIPSYSFANTRVRAYGIYQPWLFTGPLRGPNRLQNTYANESFMDEIASAIGADPVTFRLRHTTDARLIDAINRAAASAGWQARPSPNPATGAADLSGRGISALHYEGHDGYVAAIAEVQVAKDSGQVQVKRVIVAHDCGTIVNPDGLRNQIEGNVVQAMSRALMEEVHADADGVTSLDWQGYPIITFAQLPSEVKIELIVRTHQPALGAGEPTTCAIAGAIGNAIFDATGARLRRLPFTPDRVKAAMSA